MSAAEKLKWIDERVCDPRDFTRDKTWAALSVYDALPQIVAVVEAAERGAVRAETLHLIGFSGLDAALAALDEAL